jgi:putative membrane protein
MMWHGPFGYADGDWSWFWPFHFVIPILFVAVIVTVIVLLVRYFVDWSGHPARLERRSAGLDALAERYARGEISRDELLEKKRDIVG